MCLLYCTVLCDKTTCVRQSKSATVLAERRYPVLAASNPAEHPECGAALVLRMVWPIRDVDDAPQLLQVSQHVRDAAASQQHQQRAGGGTSPIRALLAEEEHLFCRSAPSPSVTLHRSAHLHVSGVL
jgi:hypothetical protein